MMRRLLLVPKVAVLGLIFLRELILANMVTLTPGTTSLFISDDRETLYVHVMDTPSPEATIASIKDGFEKKVMETFR